jgi:hypothetical protein
MVEQSVATVVHHDAPGGHMLVDLAFTILPALLPKPSLISWNRQRWPKLQHPVLALNDLNLGTWLIEMQAAPHIGRQRNDTTSLHADISTEGHTQFSHAAAEL